MKVKWILALLKLLLTGIISKLMQFYFRIYNRLHQLKQNDNQLSDIAIVDAGVKVVKFKYQGIPLDVSINQYSGISALWML